MREKGKQNCHGVNVIREKKEKKRGNLRNRQCGEDLGEKWGGEKERGGEKKKGIGTK